VNIASPDAGEWLEALASLNEAVANSRPNSEATHLRTFYNLLQNAPPGTFSPAPMVKEKELEAMISSGANEAAVLRTISPLMGYMISRAPGINCETIASVWVPGADKETTARNATVAGAIMSAASAALYKTHIATADGSMTKGTTH